MGNYSRIELDFVERTLKLIEQYDQIKSEYSFEERYDHTLLINCMLGLIVLPKEKSLSFIPKERLVFIKTLNEWGIHKSWFNEALKDTKDLFRRLRNSVAHFDIEFLSETSDNYIDLVKFMDVEANMHVATFHSDELRQFIKFYADILIQNMKR